MVKMNIYIRTFSVILITALFCSACGAPGKDVARKSFPASGTAVMTPAGVETGTPAGIQAEEEEETKTEETKKDKDGTVWDTGREVTVEKDGFTYHAYLSKDGRESWIYQADPGAGRAATLAFPEEVQGAVVTKLGKIPDNDDTDCCYDIFGNSEEPWHEDEDSWTYTLYKNTKGIRKIICPPAVKTIKEAAFSGFCDLEEIELPEQLKRIERYLLFFCRNLKKITLPRKPDFVKTYGCLRECNHIEEVVLPEGSSDYCIKDGMLLSKDEKTLYQVFVTGETVKIPEGVTRIATGAVNTIDISKIRSIRLSSTLRKLDQDAILNENEKGELVAKIKSVTVDDKNPFLAQAENCIYEKATGTLVVFVGTKKNMVLPKEIRYIGDSHIQLGKLVKKLVIPATFQGFKITRGEEEKIDIGEITEFHSAEPPEIAAQGKGEIPALYFLIVPKKSVRSYKKWYQRLHGTERMMVKTKGKKAYITMEGYEDIMEQYGLISSKK